MAAAGDSPAALETKLETIQTTFGSVRALVHRRNPEAEPAPFVVIMVPGNPGVVECPIGKFHSHTPGMRAISDVLWSAQQPYIQFDFCGVGLSAPDGPSMEDTSVWRIDDASDPRWLYKDRGLSDIVSWARKHVHERVVLCCWNWSGYAARDIVKSGELSGFVSISLPYNILMLCKMRGDEAAYTEMKGHFEDFVPNAACRALYVCGSKDAMCPVPHIKRLNKKRGDQAIIHVIDQTKDEHLSSDDKFNLVGHEADAAQTIGTWLANLALN